LVDRKLRKVLENDKNQDNMITYAFSFLSVIDLI